MCDPLTKIVIKLSDFRILRWNDGKMRISSLSLLWVFFLTLGMGIRLVMGFQSNVFSMSASNIINNNKMSPLSSTNLLFHKRLTELTVPESKISEKNEMTKFRGRVKIPDQRSSKENHRYPGEYYKVPPFDPKNYRRYGHSDLSDMKHNSGQINSGQRRSALDMDDYSYYDGQTDASSMNELSYGHEMSDEEFFKNFEDHAEDPMAQESGGPSLYYAKPEFPNNIYKTGSDRSEYFLVDDNRHYRNKYDSGNTYPEEYDMRPVGSAETDKNVVYLSGNKLSDQYYYEEEVNEGQIHPNYLNSNEQYFGTLLLEEVGTYGNADSGTQLIEKATVIDRVSRMYTNYKFLVWAAIMVLASITALAALFSAYLSNPPTEVVLAREILAKRARDPSILNLLAKAILNFGNELGSGKCAWAGNCTHSKRKKRKRHKK